MWRSGFITIVASNLMGFWSRVSGYRSKNVLNDDARYEIELVNTIISEGRSLYTDPEFISYMSLKNPQPVGNDLHGEPKYGLIEMPAYIKGREKMSKRGADLTHLYGIILMLRYGYMPPENCKAHKILGDMDGRMECLVQGRRSDWVLIYRYNEKDLVLIALMTGNHKECGDN